MTYSGPSAGLAEYAAGIYNIAKMGTPPVANAPELFLELCDTLKTNNQIDLAIVDTVVATVADEISTASATKVIMDTSTANNYFYETYLLFIRNFTNIVRTKELFLARIGAVVGFGFLVGSLFYRRPRTDVGVTERVAYLVGKEYDMYKHFRLYLHLFHPLLL